MTTTKKTAAKKTTGPPKSIQVPTPENDEHDVRGKLEAIRQHISGGLVGVPISPGNAARYAIVTAYEMLIGDDTDEAVGGAGEGNSVPLEPDGTPD